MPERESKLWKTNLVTNRYIFDMIMQTGPFERASIRFDMLIANEYADEILPIAIFTDWIILSVIFGIYM